LVIAPRWVVARCWPALFGGTGTMIASIRQK
jgi:hypothetical protein